VLLEDLSGFLHLSVVTELVPCVDAKPRSNVVPDADAPEKVNVAGNRKFVPFPPVPVAVPPFMVEWPLAEVRMQLLKIEVAPPLIWHEPLSANPVPVPVLVSVKEKCYRYY
jgi:hypothetical protein